MGFLRLRRNSSRSLVKRIRVESDLAFAGVRLVAAGVTVAALVGAACRQVDRRNVCQAGQAGGREHRRFSLCRDHLGHGWLTGAAERANVISHDQYTAV